jgi:hypothetical protein
VDTITIFAMEVVVNLLTYDHDILPFYHIICMLYPKTQGNGDGVHFVLDQYAQLDLHSASSLKQRTADIYVAPLGRIILIPSQPIFAFSP